MVKILLEFDSINDPLFTTIVNKVRILTRKEKPEKPEERKEEEKKGKKREKVKCPGCLKMYRKCDKKTHLQTKDHQLITQRRYRKHLEFMDEAGDEF
jgi:hypothetical protein